MAYEDVFHTFVAAIFYVGKGKRSRPYAHLHEAISLKKVSLERALRKPAELEKLLVNSLLCPVDFTPSSLVFLIPFSTRATL